MYLKDVKILPGLFHIVLVLQALSCFHAEGSSLQISVPPFWNAVSNRKLLAFETRAGCDCLLDLAEYSVATNP